MTSVSEWSSKVSKFQLESPKMIQDLSDATASVEISDSKDNLLNEVRTRLFFRFVAAR